MQDLNEEKAIKFIKKNKKLLKEKFAGDYLCSPTENPITIFMAGSPGAGKTEVSKNLIKVLKLDNIVRIDADEIRDFIPGYDGKNSELVQRASALGVEYLLDCVLRKKKSFILDATFADYRIARKNITRALDKNRNVEVIYVYQDPFKAWEFTKAREAKEGRRVPKEVFVKNFLEAKMSVRKIKKEFDKKIDITLVLNSYKPLLTLHLKIKKTSQQSFDEIFDKFIKTKYNYQSLLKAIG